MYIHNKLNLKNEVETNGGIKITSKFDIWKEFTILLIFSLLVINFIVYNVESQNNPDTLGYDVEVTCNDLKHNVTIVENITIYNITVKDTGENHEHEDIEMSKISTPPRWNSTLSKKKIRLQPGQQINVTLTVYAPSNATIDEFVRVEVIAEVVDGSNGPPPTKPQDSIITLTKVVEIKKYPDFAIFDNAIFITENIIVGKLVKINITVYNFGDENGSAIIDFFVGEQLKDNLHNSTDIHLLKKTNKIVTFNWIPERKGKNSLYFFVRNSKPQEINLINNKANITVDVAPKENNPILTPFEIMMTISITGGFFVLFVGFTEVGKYRFLIFLLPLYSRIKGLDVFKHKDRDRIYDYIVTSPGEHLHSLSDGLDINLNTLTYHLRVLEREEYIISYKDGVKRRFFPKKMKLPRSEVSRFYPNIVRTYNVGNVQLSEIQLQIFKTIKENQNKNLDGNGMIGISQKDIASKLTKRMKINISKQVVNYHVKLLSEGNLIKMVKDGNKVKCYISEEFNT